MPTAKVWVASVSPPWMGLDWTATDGDGSDPRHPAAQSAANAQRRNDDFRRTSQSIQKGAPWRQSRAVGARARQLAW
jgi:hypothetical protein